MRERLAEAIFLLWTFAHLAGLIWIGYFWEGFR